MEAEVRKPRFVRVPLKAVKAGRSWFVIREGERFPRRFSEATFEAWRACTGAKTLDAHRERIAEASRTDSIDDVQKEISRLLKRGYIIPEDDLASLASISAEPHRDALDIKYLAIPTADRVELCRRLSDSLLPSLTKRERCLIVAEDSSQTNNSEQYSSLVRELEPRSQSEIILLNRSVKDNFVQNFERFTQNETLVGALRIALGGTQEWGRQAGANRNTILLATLGSGVVSMDDDTISRFCRTNSRDDELRVWAGHDPTDFRYFADRADVEAAAEFDEAIDVIELHRSMLGRSSGDMFGDETCLRAPNFSDQLATVLANEHARVLVTTTGLAGDCGMGSARYQLFSRQPSFGRLVANESGYRQRLQTRDVIRGVEASTLSVGTYLMAPCIGLDNRESLPPFVPTFRNSDGLFARTLRGIDGRALIGHLPWAVLHDAAPREPFSIESIVKVEDSIRAWIGVLAAMILSGLGSSEDDVETRLASLGSGLRRLSSLPTHELVSNIWSVRLRSLQEEKRQLGEALDEWASTAPLWAEDVKVQIRSIDNAISSERLIFNEIPGSPGTSSQHESFARFLGVLGELFTAWPEIISATRELDRLEQGLLDCARRTQR